MYVLSIEVLDVCIRLMLCCVALMHFHASGCLSYFVCSWRNWTTTI